MNKSYLIIIVFIILASCDTTDVAKDGKVSVRYAISASHGAVASVSYFGENGASMSDLATDGWTYEFRVEEGSQLLYIVTNEVLKGSVEAQIYVDDELHRSHVHVAPNSTAEISMGTSAWGRNGNIKLSYYVQSGDLQGTKIGMINGKESFEEPDDSYTVISAITLESWTTERISRELIVAAGFEASVQMDRSAIESGNPCVDVLIQHEPIPEQNWLMLFRLKQCDAGPVDVDYSMPVPGY